MRFDRNVIFDYGMINQSPQVTNGMLVIESNGTFFDALSPHNGYSRTDFNDFDQGSKQMQLHMNDYVFNTLLWAMLNDETHLDLTEISSRILHLPPLMTDVVGKYIPDVLRNYGPGRRCHLYIAPCVSDASEYFVGGLNASFHSVANLTVEKQFDNGTVINETAIAGEFRGYATSKLNIINATVFGKDFEVEALLDQETFQTNITGLEVETFIELIERL